MPEYASNIVGFVSDSMSDALGTLNRRIVIKRSDEDYPYYEPGNKDVARIFLCTDGDDEYLWLHQFSHELTHAYIDSMMPDYHLGLWWFEEVICCLSSLYHLVLLDSATGGRPLHGSSPNQTRAARCIEHVRNLRPGRVPQIPLAVGNWPWMGEMTRIPFGYNEDRYIFYEASALHLLPMFLEHPILWRMVGLMRDVRIYPTMEVFLEKCERLVDDSWRWEFFRLKQYLLHRTKDFCIFVGNFD